MTVCAHAMVGSLVEATGKLPTEDDIKESVRLAEYAADLLAEKMQLPSPEGAVVDA